MTSKKIFHISQVPIKENIPGPSEAGGWGGAFSAPNNLLKFADFEGEKVVKAKIVRIKIQICIYSRKLPESIKNAISFDVIQVKNSKFSWKDSH